MIRRHRPVGPRKAEQVGLHGCGRLRRGGKREQGTDTLAIETEILVAAIGDQQFGAVRRDYADAGGILGKPVAQPLIGEIDEGQQTAFGHNFGQRLPLRHIEIGAGWIVTAAVQQYRVPAFGVGQGIDYFIEAKPLSCDIDVPVRCQLQSRRVEDRGMVRPGWRTDMDPCVGLCPSDQFGAQSQRASAAGRLQT